MFLENRYYLIRTVTFYYYGRIFMQDDGYLLLKDGEVIHDLGDLSKALETQKFPDSVKVGEIIINKSALVDAFLCPPAF